MSDYLRKRGFKEDQRIDAPYFLATKLSTFNDRGKDDYVMSHDVEDIVAVLDAKLEILGEVEQADKKLKKHLTT